MNLSKENISNLYQKVLQAGIDKYDIGSPDRIVLTDDGEFDIEIDTYSRGYFDQTEHYPITAEDLATDRDELISIRLKREEDERRAAQIRREQEEAERRELDKKRRFEQYQKLKKEFEN